MWCGGAVVFSVRMRENEPVARGIGEEGRAEQRVDMQCGARCLTSLPRALPVHTAAGKPSATLLPSSHAPEMAREAPPPPPPPPAPRLRVLRAASAQRRRCPAEGGSYDSTDLEGSASLQGGCYAKHNVDTATLPTMPKLPHPRGQQLAPTLLTAPQHCHYSKGLLFALLTQTAPPGRVCRPLRCAARA